MRQPRSLPERAKVGSPIKFLARRPNAASLSTKSQGVRRKGRIVAGFAVFLCYRRKSAGWPVALRDRLEGALGPGTVFMDVHGIKGGDDFESRLADAVADSDAMVVIIGPDWLEEPDPRTGLPKIQDQLDFVHIEIMTALIRRIPIFPVLIEGARMPHESELPPLIRGLAKQQAQDLPQNNLMDAAMDKIVATVAGAVARGGARASPRSHGDDGARRSNDEARRDESRRDESRQDAGRRDGAGPSAGDGDAAEGGGFKLTFDTILKYAGGLFLLLILIGQCTY